MPGRPGDVALLDAFTRSLGDVAGVERVARQLRRIDASSSSRSLHDLDGGVTGEAPAGDVVELGRNEDLDFRQYEAGSA